MNKEELITKKIDSLKCKGQYGTDIKDSINKCKKEKVRGNNEQNEKK